MNETKIGGTKKKITNILSMAVLLILFVAYMFPFVMVVINSLKQKRDIIKSPFSWLFTIKGLSFDNFVKAFTQMDFPRAFGNSLIVTVSATLLVTLFASMLAYYIVRHNIKADVFLNGSVHDYSFSGHHDSSGKYLRRYFEYLKPQNHPDFYAYRIFHGYVGLYVPWIYQGQHAGCFGRSGLY